MNREERIAYIMKKRARWNVWRIENRWLRSLAALPVFLLLVIVVLPVSVVLCTAIGIARGTAEGFQDAFEGYDRDIWVTMLSALLGRARPIQEREDGRE